MRLAMMHSDGSATMSLQLLPGIVPRAPEETSLISIHSGSSNVGGNVGLPRGINPSWPTWQRRLDTTQDPFNLHKWAGLAWLLSSAGIIGLGSASGFTELPDGIEPVTNVFLLSTLVQSLSSIPMALRYRAHEPTVQRGFISSAISSITLAFLGWWVSPFAADHALGPEFATGWVVFCFLVDSLFNLAAFRDVSVAFEQLQALGKGSEDSPQKFADLFSALPLGLPLNIYTLQHMFTHIDMDLRDYVLNAITERGSSVELVFYTSMLSTIAIGVGNLAATLSHRKLISKDAENLLIVGAMAGVAAFNYRSF